MRDPFADPTLRRADDLGLRPPAHGVVLLLSPSFHPDLALRLEDLGEDGWWLEGLHAAGHRDRLKRIFDVVLPPAEGAALLSRISAEARRPRRVLDGQIRDGITGAARVSADGDVIELAGHYALLGAEDPLHPVTELLLSATAALAPGPIATLRRYLVPT